MKYTVDCFSGGAIKGVVEVLYAEKIEKETGLPFWKTRDMIVGASVGGIVGGVLASGLISAEHFSAVYDDFCKRLFKKKSWLPFQYPKYDKEQFHQMFEELLGVKNYKLGDVKTRLIVLAVDMVENKTFGGSEQIYFKSWGENNPDRDRTLSSVLVSGFSAPIYFGTSVFRNDPFSNPVRTRVFTDGGVLSDNLPISAALIESECLGFYERENDLTLTAVGALYSVDQKECDPERVAKERMLGQVMDLVSPGSLGTTRKSSTLNDIIMMQKLCAAKKNLHFKMFDKMIAEKEDAFDRLDLLPKYRKYGQEMILKPIVQFN